MEIEGKKSKSKLLMLANRTLVSWNPEREELMIQTPGAKNKIVLSPCCAKSLARFIEREIAQ